MTRRAGELLLGLLVRCWVATLRLTVVESPALAAAAGRPRAYAFWHGQQFALLRWARGRKLSALVSRSRDGALVAAALRALGVSAHRGSSSRGGLVGLRGLVRALRDGWEAAFAVDGPRGPRGIVRETRGRAGVTAAAELAGGVVVPLASACARARVFRSWDGFELPLPFTRIAVALGAPLGVAEATPERLKVVIDSTRGSAEAALAASGGFLPATTREHRDREEPEQAQP